MKIKAFATEVDLCARFIEKLPDEWIAYAETGGWDIVLVRKADGFQIGIEAKLKLNLQVINQAIEDHGYWHSVGQNPDCRAILVPAGEGGFGRIASYIGVTIIYVYPPDEFEHGGMRSKRGPFFTPNLPKIGETLYRHEWHEWCPIQRVALPAYIPDVKAGASAPVQLTEWKIAAIKIAITLERRGYVTRSDFKEHRIDHRRWLTPTGWLRVKDGHYIKGSMPDFKKQHPRVYKEIEADADKWMPKESTMPKESARLL